MNLITPKTFAPGTLVYSLVSAAPHLPAIGKPFDLADGVGCYDGDASLRQANANPCRTLAIAPINAATAATCDSDAILCDWFDLLGGSSQTIRMQALMQSRLNSQTFADACTIFNPGGDKMAALQRTVSTIAFAAPENSLVQGLSIACKGVNAIATLRPHGAVEVGPVVDLMSAFIQAGGLIASSLGAETVGNLARVAALLVDTTKGAVLFWVDSERSPNGGLSFDLAAPPMGPGA